MLLGMLQFYYAQPLFGSIGDKPNAEEIKDNLQPSPEEKTEASDMDKRNPFLPIDYALIALFVFS